jgi:hypothetical protein
LNLKAKATQLFSDRGFPGWGRSTSCEEAEPEQSRKIISDFKNTQNDPLFPNFLMPESPFPL